jgi:hypothetical protein
MNKRELRLAIKDKLDHRRRLIKENGVLREDLRREHARNKFLEKAINNPMVDQVLEHCADEIMKAVVFRAIEASEVVAEQTVEDGDYLVGIDIPSLHIRQRIYRETLRLSSMGVSSAVPEKQPVKLIDFQTAC